MPSLKHAPDTVFEPVVAGSGVDVITSAQLLDISQSLELWRVDDSDAQWIKLNVAVDAVVEHLVTQRHTSYWRPRNGRHISKYTSV